MPETMQKQKLLIVEDDVGLQRQYRWNFENYEVFVAGTRAEALDILRAEMPKVVTLDLGLPPDPDGTSEGFATLESILSLSTRSRLMRMSSALLSGVPSMCRRLRPKTGSLRNSGSHRP
jgi:two-component system NtrC family response regulator